MTEVMSILFYETFMSYMILPFTLISPIQMQRYEFMSENKLMVFISFIDVCFSKTDFCLFLVSV